MFEASCEHAYDIKPFARYAVWTYDNDWDGWHLHSTHDEIERAQEWHDRLAGLTGKYGRYAGVVVMELVAQTIRPDAKPKDDTRE